MNPEDILREMRVIVAESLVLKPAAVTAEKRLMPDLGADSLDFVDILFAIEQRFEIDLRGGDFEFLSRLDFSSPGVMKNGALTEETLTRLQEWLPAVRQAARPVTPSQLFSWITIETLCRVVERKLAATAKS